ncbi:hypothetical protein AgCh_021984 [Apium graveolens]
MLGHKVMQVKHFGCSGCGRTKWSLLVNEDTTDCHNPDSLPHNQHNRSISSNEDSGKEGTSVAEVVEEWDEMMTLHGDIIEGIAEDANDELLFVKAKGRSDFSLQLGKISRRREDLWLKVRRGENVLKLRVCVVPEWSSKLQKKFTFRAASSDKHVAVLADLTFDQCCELQEAISKSQA